MLIPAAAAAAAAATRFFAPLFGWFARFDILATASQLVDMISRAE